MGEWIDRRWIDERMNRRMNVWTENGRTDGWITGWIDMGRPTILVDLVSLIQKTFLFNNSFAQKITYASSSCKYKVWWNSILRQTSNLCQ